MKDATPEKQLAGFIAKFTPAALALGILVGLDPDTQFSFNSGRWGIPEPVVVSHS